MEEISVATTIAATTPATPPPVADVAAPAEVAIQQEPEVVIQQEPEATIEQEPGVAIQQGQEAIQQEPEAPFAPEIARTLTHAGVTFDVFKPEELGSGIPTFGDERRGGGGGFVGGRGSGGGGGFVGGRMRGVKRLPDEAEVAWEKRRRSSNSLSDLLFFLFPIFFPLLTTWKWGRGVLATIGQELFDRVFTDMPETTVWESTDDGLRLPRLPAWLNVKRETQDADDGRPGVFLVRPERQDFETRFEEMMELLEPYGVEMGVVKIKIPQEWHDPPPSAEDLQQQGQVEGGNLSGLELYTMTQRLPLHPASKSSLTPIYHVLSTPKRWSPARKWKDLVTAPLRPHLPLTEEKMCARGRRWNSIVSGTPQDGTTEYSSDNDVTPQIRAYFGLSDPKLTGLPGNVLHQSLEPITGIHTPYLYIGQSYTMFALHSEDYNALSLNYQHSGSPKTWRVCSPRDFSKLEDFVSATIPHHHLPFLPPSAGGGGGRSGGGGSKCSQFIRHQSIFLPRQTLEAGGVRSWTTRQTPGEMVVTWPLAYHEGWNEGINVNEACGYGTKRWKKLFAEIVSPNGTENPDGTGNSNNDSANCHGTGVYRPCEGKCSGSDAPPIRLVYSQ